MKARICKFAALTLALSFAAGGSLAAQETRSFGIVFNTSSIVLDLESYQAGVGIKIPGKIVDMRFSGEVNASNNFSSMRFGLGVAVERHIRPGTVSPYFGGFAHAIFDSKKVETDAENWVQNMSIPVSAGGILGVEYFILDNLSIFGEYALAVDLGIFINKTSEDGTVVTTPDHTIAIESRIGNNSKIGVVIYVK